MSEIYNEEYYHSGCGPIPYEEPEHWNEFFGIIADRIVSDLHPKTVLDAGCAMGYLVAALRDRGVEAYGLDISEYAISMVRDDIKPYCMVGSLTEKIPEEMPRRFDLVVTIEVLEHLYEEDGRKAIANLCTLSDTILFSSTPDDYEERTHVNVQQREYWAICFWQNGFTDNLEYRPNYITKYAVCYCKGSYDTEDLIKKYERAITVQDKELYQTRLALQEKDRKIAEQLLMIKERDETIQKHIAMVQKREKKIAEQLRMIKDRDETIREHVAMVQERDRKIAEQLQMIKDRDETIREHVAMVQERDRKIAEQLQMIKDRDETIRQHIAMVQERDKIISDLK